MEEHYQLSDREFSKAFSSCALDPKLFSHEAHLRLAWIYIKKYGLKRAEENVQSQLQNFVKYAGAEDKYHTTVTLVAMRAVDHFMKKSDTGNFQDFIKENQQLKNNFKQLIDSHYSFDIFKSDKAKKEFLRPDLEGFD